MMPAATALLTFSIGPVHTFIEQARRLADQWAGSQILSHLVATAISALRSQGGTMVFPFVDPEEVVPDGLPNRFVCEVPAAAAHSVAEAMRKVVLTRWVDLTEEAVATLPACLKPARSIWDPMDQDRKLAYAERTIEVAWSWVPQHGSYAAAARDGAERFAASRMFRPFAQTDERDEKCAVCGERVALPNGDWHDVQHAWKEAPKQVKDPKLKRYFRTDQGRLCLVCTTKRLFPYRLAKGAPHFPAFDAFEPRPGPDEASHEPGDNGESKPYVGIVKMDGDRVGEVLGWGEGRVIGHVREFHRVVSEVLTRFATELRRDARPAVLNLDTITTHLNGQPLLGHDPALVYAGGEDVLFVCDPRDALPLALAIRTKYCADLRAAAAPFLKPEYLSRLTISAAICIVHTKHPAGLTFRDAEDLLKHVAKDGAGRDAAAIRLAKRGGAPVEVAFKWDEPSGDELTWLARFNKLVAVLHERTIASRQSFNLAEEEDTLGAVFSTKEEWGMWLRERLSRGAGSAGAADGLARLIAPFFFDEDLKKRKTKSNALRIARFLGREVGNEQ